MGAVCCCFHAPDVPDYNASNNSSSDDCFYPECIFHRLMNKIRAIPPPNHQASSSNSELILNISSDAGGSHNGALPNNVASSTFLQEQYNGARGRQEKGTSCSRVQPEQVGQSYILIKSNSIQLGDKIVVSNIEEGSQAQNSESSTKLLTSGVVEGGFAYIFPSIVDEDECPTCLEEYTEENPKIIAKCSHHYHLSCIYEWMERSNDCPVCRKLMLFDESS